MILALDTSLSTGWALGDEGVESFGTVCFKEYTHDYALVGRMFRRWLTKIMTEYEPTDLVLERPLYFPGARNGATYLLNGLAWEANRAAEIRGIPRHEYSPISIKKYITGDHRAKKPQVMSSVRALGHDIQDDNQGDAVALLLLHMSK